jgi:hypothetical protein
MKDLAEGDIVIYSDCGIAITEPPEPLLDICRRHSPIVLFGNGNHINSMWTKRDCFVLMDCDREAYWKASHCDAAFSLFRKTALSEQFLREWLHYGSDERIISDLPNTCGKRNFRDFIEHRWDQSILSLLAQKYRLPLYRMPTQFGNHYMMHAYRQEQEFNCINQLDLTQVGHYAAIPYYNSEYGQLLDHHRSKAPARKKSFVARTMAKIRRRVKIMIWVLRNLRPYK